MNINIKTKLTFQCNKGHQFKTKYNYIQQGHGCPNCSFIDKSSKPEKEIVKDIKTYYTGTILLNDRTQVRNYWTKRNLELDIFLPDINKAIEFNGVHWHRDDYSKWKNEMKLKQCLNKGITLLNVPERDWLTNKEQVKNNIRMFINEI